MELGSDAPLTIAVIALLGSIIATSASIVSAFTAKRTAYFTARSARFSEWQMYKRQVYAEFLAAARTAAVSRKSKKDVVSRAFDSARLAAGEALLPKLDTFYDAVVSAADGRSAMALESHVRLLSDAMIEDVSTEPRRRPGGWKRAVHRLVRERRDG